QWFWNLREFLPPHTGRYIRCWMRIRPTATICRMLRLPLSEQVSGTLMSRPGTSLRVLPVTFRTSSPRLLILGRDWAKKYLTLSLTLHCRSTLPVRWTRDGCYGFGNSLEGVLPLGVARRRPDRGFGRGFRVCVLGAGAGNARARGSFGSVW